MMRRLMVMACGVALATLAPMPVLAEHGEDHPDEAGETTTTIVVTIRQRAENLGGTADVESRPGGGTALSVRIPAVTA